MDKSNTNLPESPASVTARVVSDKGFHLLFTLRDTTGVNLLSKFDEFQRAVLLKGWKPEEIAFKKADMKADDGKKNSTAAVIKTICAKCGAPALRKSGLRKDKSLWEGVFCSTGEEAHKVWLS